MNNNNYTNPNPNINDPLDTLERGEVSPSFTIDIRGNGAAFLAVTGRAPDTGNFHEEEEATTVPQLIRQTNNPTVFPSTRAIASPPSPVRVFFLP